MTTGFASWAEMVRASVTSSPSCVASELDLVVFAAEKYIAVAADMPGQPAVRQPPVSQAAKDTGYQQDDAGTSSLNRPNGLSPSIWLGSNSCTGRSVAPLERASSQQADCPCQAHLRRVANGQP